MPAAPDPPSPARAKRPRAALDPVVRIDSEFLGKVAVTAALQERHETRITRVEEALEQHKATLREVTTTLSAVAQQVEQNNTRTETMSVQSVEMHDWIEEARRRQPEREQKDQDIAALLAHLAASEEQRQERERKAEEDRTERERKAEDDRKAEADRIADQLAEHEAARVKQQKRNNAYMQAIGGFVGLMLIALAPSSVGQTPDAWHPALYVVYLIIVLVAGAVAIIRPLRAQDERAPSPGGTTP